MVIKRLFSFSHKLATVAILVSLLILALPSSVAKADTVNFPDPNLETAIRNAIGKPSGNIYTTDLEGLTSLNAHNKEIANLTGMEYCTSLTRLGLIDNQISDLSPLSSLTSLTELNLNYNQISNLSPLSSLTSLTELNFNYNQISDLSPLSSLTSLTELNLNCNQISDLSPLSSLTKLEILYLSYNQISDLSSLTSLTSIRGLILSNNQISNIEPLVSNIGISAGDTVDLHDNPLSSTSLYDYISELDGRGVNVLYITIHANFTATPLSGDEPLTVSFTDLSASHDGIDTWLWDFGDGDTSNNQNPTHEYAQDGTYTISLTITEDDDDSYIKTDNITVSDIGPIANFSAIPLSGNEPLTVSFTDLSASHDGIDTWLWDFGDGDTSTDQNPTHEYAHNGTYTVSLTVTEDDDDFYIKTYNITVSNAGPVADFSATPLRGDELLTVSFTDLSASYDGINTWLWYFGDGNGSADQNPTHEYAQDGTYIVSLMVTEADGDYDTETKTNYIIVTNISDQQTISPDDQATIESDDGQIVIEFPKYSVEDDAVITIRKVSQDGLPACPSGYNAGATCFSVELTAALVPGTMVAITVKYVNADLDACDGDPDRLTLARYDEDTGEWVILSTTVDADAMTLTASTDQLSTWMVMEKEAQKSSYWIRLIAVLGGLGVIIIITISIIIMRLRLAKGKVA